MLKAFVTYTADLGPSEGCMLVFAHTRGEAKAMTIPYWGDCFLDVGARRVPDYDQYADGDKPYEIPQNCDMPDGAPPFYSDDDEYFG